MESISANCDRTALLFSSLSHSELVRANCNTTALVSSALFPLKLASANCDRTALAFSSFLILNWQVQVVTASHCFSLICPMMDWPNYFGIIKC